MNDEQTTETSAPAEEVTEATETEVTETADTSEYAHIYFSDEYQFYDYMYNSFEEFRLDNTEQNELIVYDMNRIAKEIEEYQLSTMIIEMLTCGLLGIIIGVCLVNIFKKR